MEILNVIDDHSRLFVASCAYPTAKAADVVDVVRSAIELHGTPASLLCDNGAVFTATPRGGKVLLQLEMERLGVIAKNSRPYHPQACDNSMPSAAATTRSGPTQALGGRTPLQAYSARLKARPVEAPEPETHFRVRHDEVDTAGTVSLRHASRLHHIGLGRAHKGKAIKLLVADRDIRVLDARPGELIRRLTLDPSRDFQPIEGG